VNIRLLASVACAALIPLSLPAQAATNPQLPAQAAYEQSDPGVAAFYSAHPGGIWLRGGADSSAARELIGILKRAALDGMPQGPAMAAQVELLLARAQAGDAAALSAADRILSAAWIQYVQALQTPPTGMTYADRWVTPRRDSVATILARAAAAPSLAAYVRRVSEVNPIYAQLRDAAWTSAQANGGALDRAFSQASTVRAMCPPKAVTSWSIPPGRVCT